MIVLIILEGAVEEIGHNHQIFALIFVRGWTIIPHVQIGVDQKMHVENRAKHIATA